LPRECLSPLRGFSFCPNCLATIKWYDNIPLLSFILLKGKCRNCKVRISFLYPAIELLFGLVTLIIYLYYLKTPYLYNQGVKAFIVLYFLVFVIIVSSVIDIKYRIIPDELTLGGLILGFISSPWVWVYNEYFYTPLRADLHPLVLRFLYSLIGAIVGGGVLYLIGVIGEVIFRKEAMGFGDVKFLAMFGAFLGWQMVVISFFAACFIGSLVGAIYFLITKEHYIPFGPFLSAGLLLSIFSNEFIIHLLKNVFGFH